jgi:hypothetical protein
MNIIRFHTCLRFTLLLGLTLGLLTPQPGSASVEDFSCAAAVALDAGDNWSATTPDQALGQPVALSVARPGWLAIQAELVTHRSAGQAGVPTWLEVLSPDCGGDTLRVWRARGFLNHLLVRVEAPGTLYLRFGTVTAVDAGAFGGVQLVTRLLSAPPWLARVKDGEPGDGTEDADGEILPRILPTIGGVLVSGKDGEPGDATEDEDGEILPRWLDASGRGWPVAYQAELLADVLAGWKDGGPGSNTEDEDGEILPGEPCDGSEPNNDVVDCASIFDGSGESEGDIESAEPTDHDYYTFTLSSTTGVSITGRTLTGLEADLRDDTGSSVATSTPNLTLGGFDLSATLVAGTYYLRVKGDGTNTGSYTLTLN